MRLRTLIIIAISLLSSAQTVYAGPYTDTLSKCLVESTSMRDRNNLVVWMFASASQHPAVEDIVTVTDEQLDEANRKMAELLMNLLTVACHDETAAAFQYEGQSTIEASFTVLGSVAGREMFSSPSVGEAMSGMNKYLDEGKLKSVFKTE
jgi:hypothetical protein